MNGINQFLDDEHRQNEKLGPDSLLDAEWIRVADTSERAGIPQLRFTMCFFHSDGSITNYVGRGPDRHRKENSNSEISKVLYPLTMVLIS